MAGQFKLVLFGTSMCDVWNMARLSWPILDINMRRPEYAQFELALFGTSMSDVWNMAKLSWPYSGH